MARPGEPAAYCPHVDRRCPAPFEAWYSVRVTRRGAPCFGTTRLPVAAVGGRMLGGDTIDAIRTDYPYLSADDVVFAVEFVRRHPR